MKKVFALSALGFTAWIVLVVSWAALSLFTPVPGPSTTVATSVDRATSVVDGARVPAALAVPRQVAVAGLRGAGGLAARIYRAPERVVSAWIGCDEGLAETADGVPRRPAISPAPSLESRVEAEVEAELNGLSRQLERDIARSTVEARLANGELAAALRMAEGRLELRLPDAVATLAGLLEGRPLQVLVN